MENLWGDCSLAQLGTHWIAQPGLLGTCAGVQEGETSGCSQGRFRSVVPAFKIFSSALTSELCQIASRPDLLYSASKDLT